MEYKKTERIFKFKRAYFKDAECKQFSHFKDWGIDINQSSFDTPNSNNLAQYFKDLQYFELENRNEERTDLYCEGDVVSYVEYDEKVFYEIMFTEGQFILNAGRRCKTMKISMLTFCDREGNIFENPNLVE